MDGNETKLGVRFAAVTAATVTLAFAVVALAAQGQTGMAASTEAQGSAARGSSSWYWSSGSSQSKPTVRHHRVPVEDASSTVSPAVAEAEAALDNEKKDYARAEKLLLSATANSPGDYRAWFDLGRLYAATDRKPAAIDAYKKSVVAKPDLFESNLNLGLLLASTGASSEASQYLKAATALEPSDAASAAQEQFTAWMALGDVLRTADANGGFAAYQAAEKLRPSDFEPHLRVGQQLLERKDYAGAETELKQAKALNPQSEEVLASLVSLYSTENKATEAESELRSYLKLHPDNANAHADLAQALEAQGKSAEARSELEAAVRLDSTNDLARRQLAGLAAANKDYSVAESQYIALLKIQPNDGELHYQLGIVLMDERKFPQAEQELLIAVEKKPDLADAYGNLAAVAGENQHYQLALKALEARSRMLPENPGTYFLRATSYDHLRDFKKASQSYRQFLAVAGGKFPDQEWQARHRLIAIDKK
jgi:Tfp pilus assembly protein PilF